MLSGRQAKDINADDIVARPRRRSDPPDFVEKLFFELAKFPGVATRNDHYLALAYAVRDRLLHRWVRSARTLPRRAAAARSSTSPPSTCSARSSATTC